jgi:hypothetical protein
MSTSNAAHVAIRAVSYRRVSSFDQLGGTSPETQLARAEALIRQHGWEQVGDFFDGGVSGAKKSRPDLNRLFEMCRAGLVDVVVVGDLSRLSRDLRNSLNFEHELRQLGVEVIDADNRTPTHWRGCSHTSRTTGCGNRSARTPTGASSPSPKQAIGQSGPRRSAGRSCQRLTIPSARSSCSMRPRRLRFAKLSNWSWTRDCLAGRPPPDSTRSDTSHATAPAGTTSASAGCSKASTSPGRGCCARRTARSPIRGPAIISAERMAQLQKALDGSAKVRSGNRVYPLTGRIFGACGVPFNGVYRNDRGHWNHRRYECRYNDTKFNGTDKRCYCRRVDADWLEATVWAEVSKLLSDPERLLELAQQYLDLRSGELRTEADQIGSLDRRLAEARRKRTNLALAAAATGPDAVAEALAQVNHDIETLEQMREQARAWAQANAERSLLLRDVWRLTETAHERLDNPTPERMREVFAALGIRVQILSEGVRSGRRRTPPDLRVTGVLPIGSLNEEGNSAAR